MRLVDNTSLPGSIGVGEEIGAVAALAGLETPEFDVLSEWTAEPEGEVTLGAGAAAAGRLAVVWAAGLVVEMTVVEGVALVALIKKKAAARITTAARPNNNL
jgi:hypothetical protein